MSGGTGFVQVYGTSNAKNCASFGYDTAWDASGWSGDPSSGWNASDEADPPGDNDQASKTYADQYEGITDASQDFRVKSGADLINNGTRDQTNTNDLDIIGQARSTSTPTIGCWEFVPSAPTAEAVQTLPSFNQAGTGAEVFTGTSVQTLASLIQSAAGISGEITGTSIQTLASLLQAGAAVEIFTGTSIQTLASLLQAGVGVMQPSGTSIQTLASLLQSGAGVQVFTGTSVQTLASLLQSAAAVQIFTGTSTQTLASLLQAAVGVMQPSGTSIQTLASLIQAAEGISGDITGTSIQTLASLTQAGAGVEIFTGTSIQTLASLLQAAVGVMQPSGTGVLGVS